MPQSLAKILVHLIYSTKGRRLLLPHEPFPALAKYARGIFAQQQCHMIEMNNVADHVHILFDLHRTEALADVVKEGDIALAQGAIAPIRPVRLAGRLWGVLAGPIAATGSDPLSAEPAGPSPNHAISARVSPVSAGI